MMSNPPSALQQHQNLHRRQNSTPVDFEAMRIPALPTTTHRPNVHRRGQSFDQRSPIRRHHQHAGSMVNITNPGSIQPGQQILRETQQQRTARPGQQQISISQPPQCGMYTPGVVHASGTPYENMTTMNAVMQHSGNVQIAHSPFFVQEMNLPMSAGSEGLCLGASESFRENFPVDTPTWRAPMSQSPGLGCSFDENQHYFQQLHAMQMGMLHERRMSQPDLHAQSELRPLTPEHQMQTARFPLTPATTPFKHTHHMSYPRSLQSSPIKNKMDEAIRSPHPISMRRGRSLQGIVEHEEAVVPSPPTSGRNFHTGSFEVAEMPIPAHSYAHSPSHGSPQLDQEAVCQPRSSESPTPVSTLEPLPFFDETGGEMPSLKDQPIPLLTSSRTAAGSQSPSRPALSPRRMSISDLNLEPGINASIEDTNITLDDIAQYIEGPDTEDNKWICKFEDCNKRFGRKENIKSHVQTHLGDRQFRCDHCKKCFVRGHDLKRHAKIHTGTKPYPCLCGNSFARHDALTRHRQRGMCIGAFDGVVKKVIKRGRPRKHRPELDERLDKAARTRQRASEQGLHYASSETGTSASSWDSPPTETMDSLSIRGDSPFDDVALFGGPQPLMGSQTFGLPPDMFSFTPPASPQYSCGNQPSPSHRSVSPAELADMPELPSHPMLLMASHMALQHSHQSLPSLSHSSSSPAADIVAFDFAEDPMAQMQRTVMKAESDRNDFDNFLDYGTMEMGLDNGNADGFFNL